MSSYGVEAMKIYEGESLDKMVRDRPVATKPSSPRQVISRSRILAVPDGTKPVGDMRRKGRRFELQVAYVVRCRMP